MKFLSETLSKNGFYFNDFEREVTFRKKMTQYEPIFSAHQIFRDFKDLIFMFEQVDKINRHGVPQTRYVVLHTAGIFLLEQKALKRSYSLSRYVPLFSLEILRVTRETIFIFGGGVSMTLKMKKNLKLAAYIYALRMTLYDHQSIKFTFDIDTRLNEQFDQFILEYTPEHPIADRFLGMALAQRVGANESMIKNVYDLLCFNSSRFTITSEMMQSPFIKEIATSISLGTKVETLILDGFDLGEFIPSLKIIISNSSSIKKLYFRDIKFQSHLSDFKDLFKATHLIRLNELSFEKCRILSTDCSIFFDSFSSLESDIKLLSVEGCMMIRSTLDSIFQTLFFSNCFHSLETLSITDVSLSDDLSAGVFQLLCCGWVLQEKKLKTLKLRNCGLKVGKLLDNLKELDCGIETLDLGYNQIDDFPGPLGLHALSVLVLDHCTFSGDMLFQFFDLLSKETGLTKTNIDLSYANADEACFTNFYQNVQKLRIPFLAGLVWDGNPLKSASIEPFFKFLKKQKSLSILSISHCIQRSEQQKSLPFLIDLVRSKQLEQFCIAADKDESFGSPLVGVIESLLHKSQIRILDITNQQIGDIGLFLILREMSPVLEELWFDGFAPTTCDVLLNVCTRVFNCKQLKKASWPSSDVTPALSKVGIESRQDFMRRINSLKTEFINKFGELDPTDEIKTKVDTTCLTKERTLSFTSIKIKRTKDTMNINLKSEEGFVCYDDETKELLTECSDVMGCAPVLSSISEIEDKISLSALLSTIVKNKE